MLTGDNATYATNPHYYDNMGYDPTTDFAYVSMVARFPLLLVTRPNLEIERPENFFDYLRNEAETLTYATPGTGLPHHLATELLLQETDTYVTHVPYKGSPAALMDVNAGRIDFMFVDLASGKAFIEDGRVQAIAAATENRLPDFPEIPTMREFGFDDFEVYAWQAVTMPAGTPEEIIETMNVALRSAIDNPDVAARMREIGVEPVTSSPEELQSYAVSEAERWGELIRARGLEIN